MCQLRDLNDFVRICRNLPIGFDRFEPSDWPVISVEIPNLRGVSTERKLEVRNCVIPRELGTLNHIYSL